MSHRDRIECVFSTDDKYCQHLSVTLASLLANNRENALLLHIVYHGVSPENMARLRSVIEGRANVEALFYKLDVAQLRHFPVRIHLSLACYFRLFMPDVLPETSHRILYLDSDIVVRTDLRPLWETALDGALIGAARDPFAASNARLSLPPDNPEFNSGVLIVDLEGWRRERLLPVFIAYIEDNTDILLYLDQDVLNVVLRGRVKFIDYAWNFQARTRCEDAIEIVPDRLRFETMHKAPNIIHYTSKRKPWHYRDDVPYEQDYQRYLAMTPWRDFAWQDRTPRQRARRWLDRCAPAALRAYRRLRAV